MAFLGIDIGSSFVKAALLDGDGFIARVSCESDATAPERAELPLDRVWSSLVSAVREVVAKSPAASIDGIGLSCLTPALVLLDESGKPFGHAHTYLDKRGREIAERLWAEAGNEFHQSSGNVPVPGGLSALTFKALGSRGVGKYLHLNGWIGGKLTGRHAFDPANAAFTGLYSLTDGTWSTRWCEYFGVKPSWLPPIVPGEATLGELLPEAARELGLKAGIPVKLGTADTSSALLAAGAEVGDLLHVVGTTQVLATIVDKPEPKVGRLVRPLGVGKKFVHVTHNPVGGAAVEWVRRLSFSDMPKEVFYGATIDRALDHVTEVVFDPCYLAGDRLFFDRKTASFQNLTLSAKPLDLLTAVLVAMRSGHTKALADVGIPHVKRLFLTGGGADVVARLFENYGEAERLTEGSLFGIRRLFA